MGTKLCQERELSQTTTHIFCVGGSHRRLQFTSRVGQWKSREFFNRFASLSVTPRTNRIARTLGLVDDKIFSYKDAPKLRPLGASNSIADLRNESLKSLSRSISVQSSSAAVHLAKRQFLLALDGPGVSKDVYDYPISWSAGKTNLIAVACNDDIYYQDLDTKAITHMCSFDEEQGNPISLEWCKDTPTTLAVGTTLGSIAFWDVPSKTRVNYWQDETFNDIGAMSWSGPVLAAGEARGGVGLYDIRKKDLIAKLTRHKSKVVGCRWSVDGLHLATSDKQGIVNIWDARAGKKLTNNDRMGGKVKHGSPVKALAWCPWKPELLATGSTYPDGKIRIFNVKSTSTSRSSSSSIMKAEHTISLSTSITSLHWSPHCKELLSTHGSSWNPQASSARPIPVPDSPLSNSIAVHAYPSCRKVVTVTKAHLGAIGHSVLNADGTRLFTICPIEEAMKMWKVWEAEPSVGRKSAFDRYVIR
ncbi:unnamed protein product [Somion occarium]|uniref:CDC20/Fizzy WD40 domain-containing protein n=1 Tax=Somion occarium TaxID=3059160 RepID=A0ABP1CRG3_9APHY